jgi:hypothetical protein
MRSTAKLRRAFYHGTGVQIPVIAVIESAAAEKFHGNLSGRCRERDNSVGCDFFAEPRGHHLKTGVLNVAPIHAQDTDTIGDLSPG